MASFVREFARQGRAAQGSVEGRERTSRNQEPVFADYRPCSDGSFLQSESLQLV